MEITVNSSGFILILLIITLIAVTASMFLKKGDWNKKLIALGIVVVVFGFVFFSFGRPAKIIADENGISSTSYGKIEFSWDEVQQALYVPDYTDTEWKPSVKLNGIAMAGFRAGTFRIAGGENVKLITMQNDTAAVFITADKTYLLAPEEIDEFIKYISSFIKITDY